MCEMGGLVATDAKCDLQPLAQTIFVAQRSGSDFRVSSAVASAGLVVAKIR